MKIKMNKLIYIVITFSIFVIVQSCSLMPNPRYLTNKAITEQKGSQLEKKMYVSAKEEAVNFDNREFEKFIDKQITKDGYKLGSTQLRVIATGDIMLGTRLPDDSYCPPNGDELFAPEVKDILKRGDIVFGNLEGAICGQGGEAKSKKYVFAMPDAAATWISAAGYNLLSVANNHALDMGIEGCNHTKMLLEKNRINFAGYLDTPTSSFIVNGLRIGFIATAPNAGVVYLHNLEWLTSEIRKLALQNDIVIVSMHIGAEGNAHQHITRQSEEFLGENRGDPYHFARMMIDAGADLVLGHGPHVTRAIDIYKGKFIAYSLGNFCTYSRVNISGVNGIAPILELVLDKNGDFQFGFIHSTKQISRKGVNLDEQNEVLKTIQYLTRADVPETELEIDSTGFITTK